MAIKIFIDQGHNPTGYHNTGARGLGLIEEDITYQVGIYLANLLGADRRFSVLLSRPTHTTVLGTSNATSLAERVRMANEWPADYFISIHANANVNPAINGAEIYIYQYNTQAHWLAQHIMDAIVQFTALKNNGIRINQSLYVLRRANMPSLLIEMGYLTNEHDAAILRDNQWLIAYAIYIGILNYFGFEPI
ncbi:cell wall hydrolase [Anaerocolumna sedimenticola]|uniref:Cell wall hydrolase n=1 Tax=Anaerocolumna sedimenticola TaxID=2696063 RepID=A0A6P1TQD2_9FIRM|nr:N-acetylmuramoyl-L-alanine amidase [Anaerocolumna sedimenticola]QHQ62683.1 cell wall hydrolase [Anaerocolumna sedimenticola]